MFAAAAAERRRGDAIVWLWGLHRSAGASSLWAHLEWETFWGVSLWDQWATGHAPLDSFLIHSQAQEDLHLGADLLHCLRQTPTEWQEFPTVFFFFGLCEKLSL